MKRTLSPLRAAPAVALAFLIGCGYDANDRVPVQGSVTFDGAEVDDGAVVFVPEGSDPKAASQRQVGGKVVNGRYALEGERGVYPGKYRVQITWNKKTGRTVPNKSDPGTTVDEVKQAIPDKYNARTTLTADVKAEANTIDFRLSK
jgi:hypothetical protein